MILRSHYILKRESKNIYYFFKFFILAKLRNVSGYKSMFKQQLESIFIMPSTPTPNLRLAPRPKKYMPLLALRPEYVCLNISQAVKKHTPKHSPRSETLLPLYIPTDYKPKTISGVFDEKFSKYKVKVMIN